MDLGLKLRAKLIGTEAFDGRLDLLRSLASKSDSPERLRRVAKEFEAIFLNILLREMRRTIPKSGLLSGGFIEEMYTFIADREFSRKLAERGIGLWKLIYDQLIGETKGGSDVKA
ncbi:hypothetical protein DRP77_01600 [Candidatus Poribacteria bacterium]|nr:MAG: hypothetical protein DRP77_01600 [Candidatus Poribacteria bacterium]